MKVISESPLGLHCTHGTESKGIRTFWKHTQGKGDCGCLFHFGFFSGLLVDSLHHVNGRKNLIVIGTGLHPGPTGDPHLCVAELCQGRPSLVSIHCSSHTEHLALQGIWSFQAALTVSPHTRHFLHFLSPGFLFFLLLFFFL